MDARQALDDLMEISAQVDAAMLLRADGSVEESTIADAARAETAAAGVQRLVEAASEAEAGRALTHVELVTSQGCVFLVRDTGRDRAVVGLTGPSPTVGLVLYDLRTCLRNVGGAGEGAAEAASPGASDGGAGAA